VIDNKISGTKFILLNDDLIKGDFSDLQVEKTEPIDICGQGNNLIYYQSAKIDDPNFVPANTKQIIINFSEQSHRYQINFYYSVGENETENQDLFKLIIKTLDWQK
jgi:hypothetical protein